MDPVASNCDMFSVEALQSKPYFCHLRQYPERPRPDQGRTHYAQHQQREQNIGVEFQSDLHISAGD